MNGARSGPAQPKVTELKPCPFCGGSAHLSEFHAGKPGAWHAVGCDNENCIAWQLGQPRYPDEENAAETARRWNQRAEVKK